ncbi:MAG TPA: prepilin peptidase [Candidatus Saccharimonadales bacterium]|nr:prepilin peptidase [Candidatus Saccharimonadales bacterium]
MIIAALTVLGLCLGSFINALVYRLRWQETHSKKSEKYSIAKGRSICPHCKQVLQPKDLIPLLSWIFLRGKCRYCKRPISAQYPIVEASTAVLFILSYIFWPGLQDTAVETADIISFVAWLGVLTGLIALAVYDAKWMILPNKIIFPLLILATGSVLAQAVLQQDYNMIVSSAAGALVGGGIFYVLFQISGGKWIGGGDVKLGFLLGIIVGEPILAFLMLFIASLLGSIFSIPLILKSRLGSRAKIAFGPFLIASTIITSLWGGEIIDLYNNLLML